MASKLVDRRTHEAENSLEISLREAFISLEPNLRPPFPLTIPTQKEYENLNRAILYGILCESHLAKVHIKHLHGKSTDGYEYFTGLLIKIVNEMFAKLVDLVRKQLLWVTREMVNVAAVGFDGLLVALLRQIVGGDFGEENLWLCFEMICLLSSKWDCLLKEEPFVLTGALYVFLRLLADHCRVLNVPKIEALRRMEIDFCVKILRQEFHLCLNIGRDLVRLLQDLVYVPDFRDIWKDLLYNPSAFKVDGFVDISQIYSARTASKYFLLRITPEMESQLRFLLTNVKIGSHKRHQIWFMKKFLDVPERKTVVTDILRFICCAHHPCNDIIRSDIIPRWAVIGWSLKCGLKNYVEANVKLALFYDWLFFDEKVDNIMSLEPAILLMVHSLPNYIDVTHSLLEFLFILLDNYDLERKEIILRGISTAFDVIVRKGVVQSLDVLTSCDRLSPYLKQRLGKVLSDSQIHRADYLNGATALHLAALNGHSQCIRLLLADHVPSIPNFCSISCKRSKNHKSVPDFDEGALYGVINRPADGGVTALHMASLNGHVETVHLLLDLGASVTVVTLEDGTTIDLIGSGSTPLHYAARGGNVQCCQHLIARCASLTTKNANGWTPLMVARSWHKDWLEDTLSQRQEGQPKFSPSQYFCLPLMSIVEIARECGWRSNDSPATCLDPCVVCLERKCTVAAEDCFHEFCTHCALYLCSTNTTSTVAHGPPGSIPCPLCRHGIVSFTKLESTKPIIKGIARTSLSLPFCTCAAEIIESSTDDTLFCKPDSPCVPLSPFGSFRSLSCRRFHSLKLNPSLCMRSPDVSHSLVSRATDCSVQNQLLRCSRSSFRHWTSQNERRRWLCSFN